MAGDRGRKHDIHPCLSYLKKKKRKKEKEKEKEKESYIKSL